MRKYTMYYILITISAFILGGFISTTWSLTQFHHRMTTLERRADQLDVRLKQQQLLLGALDDALDQRVTLFMQLSHASTLNVYVTVEQDTTGYRWRTQQ